MSHIRRIIRAARSAGWRIQTTRAGWLLLPPDRSLTPVAIHRTPSDYRAHRNIRAQLRQRGLDV